MKPKAKALELINKYYNLFNTDTSDIKVLFRDCKKCALITVDELIIQQNKYNNGSFYPSKYWQEVKQEIEKL